MSSFFLELLKLSVSASFLIVAVMLLRLIMRKSPKSFYCILWALVGIRLICPFSFESRFSVIPKEDTIPINTILTIPDTQSELIIPDTNNFVSNDILFESENTLATSKSISIADIISGVWLVGTIGIMLYGIISYIRLKRIVSVSIKDKDNVYLCDDIDVPFIFGIFKPKIYLPSNMVEVQKEYVLLHEKAHLSRHDNLWKPVGFILLSIYWFNPLVWIAYHLFSKDIELATDERVINNLNNNEIKDYSETLLACSLIKSNLIIKTCPVAFGEVGVKDRIKAVLNYKKPSFWIILIAIISCIVVGVCFLTKPKDDRLTISKVKELMNKGDNLTFGDFEQYDGEDIGSGFFIMRYEVEPNHYLLIYPTDVKKDSKITNAFFVPNKNMDDKVDAFTQDIDEALKKENEVSSQAPISQYQNILGYDTYYIDIERSPKWYTRDYYTTIDGNDYLIMESFGFEKEREDTIKDINGDGYTELICNCVSGGDGHQEAYIYMRDLSSSTNGPSVMRCNIDYEKLELQDFYNWGVNAFSTKYEPNNNRFVITYSKGNENKSEDVTIYINDNEIMDKLSFRKHIVESTINNNTIELTTYDKEIESSYILLGSDADILKNIVSNGIWTSETCDGLPEYTFVYDSRKYGIEVFSSQIHITDMSGKGKGEIVCTGDEFNTLKAIIDKANVYRSSKTNEIQTTTIDGLNINNLKYSTTATKLLPFADNPEVYKELENISKQDFSVYKEIWDKIPQNIVEFDDPTVNIFFKNNGRYFEEVNEEDYESVISTHEVFEKMKDKYKTFLAEKYGASYDVSGKVRFVLYTDYNEKLNKVPVILVTMQGTYQSTEKERQAVKDYWKEHIGTKTIDNIDLSKSLFTYIDLIDPKTGDEYSINPHFESNGNIVLKKK